MSQQQQFGSLHGHDAPPEASTGTAADTTTTTTTTTTHSMSIAAAADTTLRTSTPTAATVEEAVEEAAAAAAAAATAAAATAEARDDTRPPPSPSSPVGSIANDRPIAAVGRSFRVIKPSLPMLSPVVGSSTGRAPTARSSRPSVPSPLSSPANYSTASPPWSSAATGQGQTPTAIDSRSRALSTPTSAGYTTFFSDSSNPSSPEEEVPRLNFPVAPNVPRNVPQTVTSKPAGGAQKALDSPMASPTTVAAQAGILAGLPRTSSIDSAISAISSSNPQSSNAPPNGQQKSEEISKLIKTAGSPEAVIQYLLKEKQSQAQQNGQLWRLVDKQRAMILGLNKDLEAALKDKERYRKKLKEMMANPAVMKAAAGQDGEKLADGSRDVTVQPFEVESPKESVAPSPVSPRLDSDSPAASPVDMTLAPYPITPPADRVHASSHSAVAELLKPVHVMPKPQEHALDKFDHEAEERAADKAWKEKSEEQLREILPFDVSLPPSRTLTSDPPKEPQPPAQAPPAAHSPPTVTVMEPTPQPSEGLATFPSPPRKGPPAPLQLNQEIRRRLDFPPVNADAESDHDDLLEPGEVVQEKRGRRRTREEDDREREILVMKEAEARSASKKSKSSKGPSARAETEAEVPPKPPAIPPSMQQDTLAPASLDAVLTGGNTRELTVPLMNTGLPASPRPFGNVKMSLNSPAMSPRVGGFAGVPLSPRPPRQPIPLPPNTPLVSPPSVSSGDGTPSAQSLNSARKAMEAGAQQPGHTKSRSSPVDRTQVYKGLVTDEYPDLLLPPNALPSIAVKVASSRMKPSRASLMSLTQLDEDPVFTLAIISRSDSGELWRVEKDLASLAKLDQRLKQCSAFTAKTPDRSLFSGHAPAKLDARRVALDQYMDELLNTPLDTATAVELCRYLSLNTLPPNADETGHTAHPKTDSTHNKPDVRPTLKGYLTKKGKNFGGWKSRFFALDGPLLKYYEAPGGAHLGTIKIQNAQIGRQSQSSDANSPANHANNEELDSQYRHAFLILERKKKDSTSHVKHVLCAESDKERDLWVDTLMQCIDYRDPEEELPNAKSNAHDRQTSIEHSSSGGGKSKKGKSHQTSGSDALFGVRYDSTHAGDTPQVAPARPKTAGGEYHTGGDFQPKIISGPKDPQLISDVAAWGNKTGLAAPTHDEKKQRKRSFFGFGPKTRSSSDGQESMFGGSEGGHGATPPQNSYQGPVRHVFGAPLAEAVRYNGPVDVSVPLPSVVYRCIKYLESQNAVLEEGIFRLSGSNIVIKQLRERFNVEGDVNLITDEVRYDIHAVASLLKLYLRELPTTILTRDLHLEFLSTTEMTDRTEKMAALHELVERLPQANATLLKYLIAFLIRIINNADVNKMTVRNVGIVFSPTLNIPAPVFAMFLQNYEAIFGIDPEEYDLPSPMPEPESHGRSDSIPRFEPPGRPSTSSGSASPHRQVWMESMRDHSRSTPTPPLLMNLSAARGSPTPSGASRQSYEASYLHHQSPRTAVGPQPGHESGSGAGHEGYNLQSSHRSSPGFDRPMYLSTADDPNGGGVAVYDQAHGTSAKRRESTIMMMGGFLGTQQPQQQGSKSRLREEAHF